MTRYPGWLKRMRMAGIAGLCCALGAVGANAATPKTLGKFGAWSAYSLTESGRTVCYLYATPEKETGKYKKRGDVFAQVTHRPHEKVRGEVSFTTGYPYKTGSEATIAIGKQRFALFTDGETAWARDRKTDATLVRAMQKGARLDIRGVSSRGTRTADRYSLKGFTAAYRAIGKACPKR